MTYKKLNPPERIQPILEGKKEENQLNLISD